MAHVSSSLTKVYSSSSTGINQAVPIRLVAGKIKFWAWPLSVLLHVALFSLLAGAQKGPANTDEPQYVELEATFGTSELGTSKGPDEPANPDSLGNQAVAKPERVLAAKAEPPPQSTEQDVSPEPDIAEPDIAEPDIAEPGPHLSTSNDSTSPNNVATPSAVSSSTQNQNGSSSVHPESGGSTNPSRGNPSSGGIDLNGLRRGYLMRLQQYINRDAEYPQAAKISGTQGVVYISITVDPQGKVLNTRVRRSSGSQTLDRAALDLVRQVKILPKPPHALNWQTRAVTLPIVYRLI